MTERDFAKPLKEFKPKNELFIGIDSDGCAFDTMEIKHKECFCPNTIKHWKLQGVSKCARQTWEFVNLYSKWRGVNRFFGLVQVMDFLAERPEVKQRGVAIPMLQEVRDWIAKETRLGSPALKRVVAETNDPVLTQTLAWNEAVNEAIADMVEGIGPFPHMAESLEEMAGVADVFVVSQTPTEALEREWKEHDIAKYVEVLAGQEMGTKSEHIRFAAGGKYDAVKMLMIGDAPGDLEAAKANDALFYPINPGDEEASWKRFHDEAFDRFVGGTFAGDYERKVIDEFEEYLPKTPPWRK